MQMLQPSIHGHYSNYIHDLLPRWTENHPKHEAEVEIVPGDGVQLGWAKTRQYQNLYFEPAGLIRWRNSMSLSHIRTTMGF